MSALTLGCPASRPSLGEAPPPAGTTWLSGDADHWRGWIELVPAIETPRFVGEPDRTSVYARLPAGLTLTLADPRDRRSLRVPIGSELDRVERFVVGRHPGVADVRGTRFESGGEVFHVYRPADGAGRLFGASWPRAEAPPARTWDALRTALLDGHDTGDLAPARRRAMVDRFALLVRCAGCHRPSQPDRVRGPDGGARRATDRSGLYSLLATLADSAVVDTYRPVDPNRRHRNISYACATVDGACSPEGVMVATLDVPAALARGDRHAREVCAARRALAPSLGRDVRWAFQRELSECGVAVDSL